MQAAIGASKRKPVKPATGIEPQEQPSPAETAKTAKAKRGDLNDDKGANGVDSETTFDLDYTDRRGHHWSGSFDTHILTINEQVQVGATRARLAGGLSPDMLDQATLDVLEMQAHLAVAITRSPEWAKELHNFRDIWLLRAIYKEVLTHEQSFWGTGPGASSPQDGATE